VSWDAIIVGSGFGGAMAAWPLVQAGQRVLMVERGGWVGRGPQNWADNQAGLISPYFTKESPVSVEANGRRYQAGSWNCVGGQSVFYGGASFRFRESDFVANSNVVGDSGAEWPFGYGDIEPFYGLAERLLGVAGDDSDPGARRSMPFPQRPARLPESSSMIAEAAKRTGRTPSRIPLAISFDGDDSTRPCMRCGACDGYACAAEAKNDLATGIIPRLIRQGMTLRANTVCVRLVRQGTRIAGIDYVDRINGTAGTLKAERIVLAAGTLATPHLLLASNLARLNPASHAVGRYLTRHRNAVVLGLFARNPNPGRAFDKHVAILDHYEEAGSMQQMSPPLGMVRAYLPRGLRTLGARFVEHASGLIVIAEDQPRFENGASVDWSTTDAFGLPRLKVRHRYSARDERVAQLLIDAARSVLREAGSLGTLTHKIDTFSHALGTVRMGPDSRTAPLDAAGRYRGLDNLYVADGSALPRSAGLNPSLTIAANALRIGSGIASVTPAIRGRTLRTLDPSLIPSTVNLI
jgi:choline dehydrogenase-like flavoprotein